MAATCNLIIAERTVVVSEGGPPDAEYALFASGDIQLEKTEPGVVREIGYRTKVKKARELLEEQGVTMAVAEELARAMQPKLATTYARGAVCRRAAREMGALEMFDGRRYDTRTKRYDGVFLDLPALVDDLGLQNAATAFQAVYLLAALHEAPDDALVFLSTIEHTRDKRPGTRTHRRARLDAIPNLATALHLLASKELGIPATREAGPSRVELTDILRLRAQDATPETRGRLMGMQRASTKREAPTKGPLAKPEIWAIEEMMSNDELAGVAEKIDRLETAGGRTPSTTYLRARLALMTGSEDVRLIAERVSALALSMTSFSELELLAAQAWAAAGEPKRALPYAKDLIDASDVSDEIRIKAREVLTAPTNALRPRKSTGNFPAVKSTPPKTPPPPPRKSAFETIQSSTQGAQPARSGFSSPPEKGMPLTPNDDEPTQPIQPQPILAVSQSQPAHASPSEPAPMPARRGSGLVPEARPSARPSQRPSARPPTGPPPKRAQSPTGLHAIEPERAKRASQHSSLPPVLQSNAPPARDFHVAPQPPISSDLYREAELEEPAIVPPPPESQDTPPQRPAAPKRRQSSLRALVEQHSPKSFFPDPRAEPDSEKQTVSTAPPPPPEGEPPAPVSVSPDSEDTPPRSEGPFSEGPFMRGVSRPPYSTDVPPATFPKAPLLPRFAPGAPPELAETLTLPPGLHGQAVQLDVLPRNVLDARIQFTHLSRELGREYRLNRRVELRADATGIEAMQRYLHEAFPNHAIETPEEALEVRRHGAFLSEILARSLGAEWVDIGPSELGYWAMIVPPGTRIWPFARIIRLIAMGHRERDLVSYYLELQTRAKGR